MYQLQYNKMNTDSLCHDTAIKTNSRDINILGNHAACNLLSLSSTHTSETSDVIQRVPELAALAIHRARFLAEKRRYVNNKGTIDYQLAMANYLKLGFKENIFPNASAHKDDADTYFVNCIESYYGSGAHEFTSLTGNGLHRDKDVYMADGKNSDNLLQKSLFDYSVNGPTLKSALTNALTEALFSPNKIYFLDQPPTAAIPEKFRVKDMFPLVKNTPRISPSTPKTATGPRATRIHSVVQSLSKANQLMNNPDVLIPPLSLSPIAMSSVPTSGQITLASYIRKKNTINFIDSYFTPEESATALSPNPHRSTNRIFVHEAGHHFENYLGVENLIRLHRAIYARTSNTNQSGKPGMDDLILKGDTLRLSVPGIDDTAPDFQYQKEALSDAMEAVGKKPLNATNSISNSTNGFPYFSSVYLSDIKNWGPGTGNVLNSLTPKNKENGYLMSTEYFSTSAEMLSHGNTAKILMDHDPVKCAIFLKLANPNKYSEVKAAFERNASVLEIDTKPNLDILLHMD